MSSLFLIFFTKYSTLLIEKVNAQAKKFLVRLVLQQTYESKYFKSVDASLSADVLWYTVAEGALHFQKELINRIAWSMRIEFLSHKKVVSAASGNSPVNKASTIHTTATVN